MSADTPQRPAAPSDWECFLLPASVLKRASRLPMHETCLARLEHLVIPAALRTQEAVRRELEGRKVCAVSWRWNEPLPEPATPELLRDWSPMSDLQLRRLKERVGQSGAEYVWVDWACVPQLSGDTMKFINSSHDVYSLASKAVFLPRLKALKRRGWPSLSSKAARDALALARDSAAGVVSSGRFSEGFNRIFKNSGRINRLEGLSGATAGEVWRQAESCLGLLFELLTGEEVVYTTFDYYARAWTLAERLAAFKPSGETPMRLGEIQDAADALLYAMSSFWRDVNRHAGAYVQSGRPSWDVSDMSLAVYMRGVDPADEDAHERWDDMNHMVQLAPGTTQVGGETAALAVICVEWLLHERAGASDDIGRLSASLLGECVAYTSLAVSGTTTQERADPEWFRKYMYFQAGNVYGSTVEQDLILAVYRSCGMRERDTADEVVESCMREVFGDLEAAEAAGGGFPLEVLCREALRHADLHAYMSPAGEDAGAALSASDFAPMLPRARASAPVPTASWHEWVTKSGVAVSWWYSNIDSTLATGPSAYVDVEHLYCGDVAGLEGLTLDELFRECATVVYRMERADDNIWRLIHLSFSRRGGRCGEGMSPYRNRNGLTLERLLSTDITRGARVSAELVGAWNGRLMHSLDQSIHDNWLQCVASADILIVS